MKKTLKKVARSKVIEAHVLFTIPKNALMRFVMMEDSIEAVILNLQEQYPDGKIKRQSILSWKFMTVGDIQKDVDLIKELNDAGHVLMAGRKRVNLPNSEQEVQVSDTSKA